MANSNTAPLLPNTSMPSAVWPSLDEVEVPVTTIKGPEVPESTDLEGHLRRLILNNGASQRPVQPIKPPHQSDPLLDPQPHSIPAPQSVANLNTDYHRLPSHEQDGVAPRQDNSIKQRTMSQSTDSNSQSSQRKTNQKQRRQKDSQTAINLPSDSHAAGLHSKFSHGTARPPNVPRPQQPQSNHQSVQTNPQAIKGGPQRKFVNGSSHQTGSQSPLVPLQSDPRLQRPNNMTNRNILPQQGQYPRPRPQNRQLYEPGTNRVMPLQRYMNFQPSTLSLQAQANYLNDVAKVQIPQAEISAEELQEKEDLRIILEQLCRTSITAYEVEKDKDFDPNTITLKCFGSLSSGFATHSSDMDLAIVSPLSKPETSCVDSEIPRLLEKGLLDQGYGARLLTRTRVPIIKFCEKPSTTLLEALRRERMEWEMHKDAPPEERKTEETEDLKHIPQANLLPGRTEIGKHDDLREYAETNTLDNDNNLKTENEFPDLKIATGTTLAEPNESSTSPTRGSTNEMTPLSTPLDNSRQLEVEITQTNSKTEDAGVIPESSQLLSLDRGSNVEDSCHNMEDDFQQPEENTHNSKSENQDIVTLPRKSSISHSRDNVKIEASSPPRSDVELVRLYRLAIGEGWYSKDERSIIFSFINAVSKHGPDGEQPELAVTRVQLQCLPDILNKYREKPTHELDFPKTGVGIQCDINFSNKLALHNTLLLRCYSRCDPRVRLMVLFVKAWAKRRKVNSPYLGTLSSYGYVLMVLHYLVNIVRPTVAPNLQLTRKAWQDPQTATLNETPVDGYDVRFWRSESEISDLAARGLLTHNEDSLGCLLRGFFHYFAHQGASVPSGGFCWTQDVLSLRTERGIVSKAEKGWTGAKIIAIEPTRPGQEMREIKHRYLLAIEDPFEIDHNIARTVIHDGVVAIRDEFRRAYDLIQRAGNGKAVPDLFLEADDRDKPWRAFGPLRREESGPARNNEKVKTGPLGQGEVPNVQKKGENGMNGMNGSKGNLGMQGTKSQEFFQKGRKGGNKSVISQGSTTDPENV
ncbi:hypothetical protein MMC12_003036 [Toensbergia leucococca]|nr:hypothetical protein [Toensbergia leucococca]